MTHHWLQERQAFYEPLSTFDQIVHAGLVNHSLAEAHVSPRWFNHIGVSFHLFKSAYTAPKGHLPLPTPDDPAIGAHRVALVGADPNASELHFVNSRGAGWGDKGYGTLTREYLDKYMVDAWLARRTRFGPSIYTFSKLEQAVTDKEFARAWMQEVPPWRGHSFRHRQHNCFFQIYDTLSFSHDGFVDVIDVKNRRGELLAWAYLHHLRGKPRVTVVKEFFVWPGERRTGLGTILESAAVDRARTARSDLVEMWVHEIDAWPQVRAAARQFLQSLSYTILWRRSQRPNIAFIATKTLRAPSD